MILKAISKYLTEQGTLNKYYHNTNMPSYIDIKTGQYLTIVHQEQIQAEEKVVILRLADFTSTIIDLADPDLLPTILKVLQQYKHHTKSDQEFLQKSLRACLSSN
jgi:hypothetical protein